VVQRPEVMDGFAAMGHDNESPLAAKVVDEQLEEGVDGKSLCHCQSESHVRKRVAYLIDIPDRV
jgi:hypothetical protein